MEGGGAEGGPGPLAVAWLAGPQLALSAATLRMYPDGTCHQSACLVQPDSMTASSLPVRSGALPTAIAGGLIAGTLDILYAWLFWTVKAGVSMQRILQSVASGLLGKESFQGGMSTAALGLVAHYFIAVAMAVTYFVVAGRMPVLRQRPLAMGAAYGLLLYVIMNFVIVPLSQASPGSKDPLWVGLSILVHMFCIGVPIALSTQRAYQRF